MFRGGGRHITFHASESERTRGAGAQDFVVRCADGVETSYRRLSASLSTELGLAYLANVAHFVGGFAWLFLDRHDAGPTRVNAATKANHSD
jgi:hypothetical protein